MPFAIPPRWGRLAMGAVAFLGVLGCSACRTTSRPEPALAAKAAPTGEAKLAAPAPTGEAKAAVPLTGPDAAAVPAGQTSAASHDDMEEVFRADAELEFGPQAEPEIDTKVTADSGEDEEAGPQDACAGGTCAKSPSKAELHVTSNVPGARVIIDDIIVGEAGDQIDVEPGKNRVKVEAPGFEAKTIEVSAKRGESVKVHVELGRGH